MRILLFTPLNFRSLKQTRWTPGDLNVVIGPNGAGKSNLLRALSMVSASAQGELGLFVQSHGGLDALLWDGQGPDMGFSMFLTEEARGDAPQPIALLSKYKDAAQPPLFLGLNVGRHERSNRHEIRFEDLLLMANQAVIGLLEAGDKISAGSTLDGVILTRDATAGQVRNDEGRWSAAKGIPFQETLLSQLHGPFAVNTRGAAVRQALADWTIYHDLRVDQDAALRRPVVARYETRLAADGQNLVNVLHTLYTGDRDFKRDVDSAMRAAFGSDFEEILFPPASDQRVQLRLRWRSLPREVSAADLSDGTLRFLLLLTALRAPEPPPLVAIDEPETGLHPSMLPIIAEHAVDAASRTQVILTTHSPQLLDAFGSTRPTTTVARWADGETQLQVVSEEALSYWLQQYTLGALFRSGELESLE